MIKPFRLALLAASFSVTVFAATAAHADTVGFTLTPVTSIATPGSTVSFMATLAAPLTNSAPVYLNGSSLTFSGPKDILFTDLLFTNFPISINPGEIDSNILFTAFIPTMETTGRYTGFYALQGGADEGAQGILTTDPFGLTVAAAPNSSVTPEPSSWLLLSTGVLGVMALGLRRSVAGSAAA